MTRIEKQARQHETDCIAHGMSSCNCRKAFEAGATWALEEAAQAADKEEKRQREQHSMRDAVIARCIANRIRQLAKEEGK
jgi:hypothetical protein